MDLPQAYLTWIFTETQNNLIEGEEYFWQVVSKSLDIESEKQEPL